MTIKVLAIGDSGNYILTLKKFVKNSSIDIIDFPRKGPAKTTYLPGGVEFFDSLKISKQIDKINEIKKKYDVCIVMSWAGARIAYLAGLNYIMYFTGNDIKTPPFIKNIKEPYLEESINNLNYIERKFYEKVFNSASHCVTSTKPFFDQLSKYRKDGIRIDRTAVDTTVFNDNVNPIDRKKEKFTFFSPQRNGPEKGIEIIWEALEKCKTDFEVLMVEWFDDRTNEEKEIIQKLLKKIPSQVKFIPLIKREEMSRYYKFADAVLGQMRAGTASGVEREAVMCKKLVISYSNPEFKDIIDNKELKNTFLPNSNEPEELAKIIDKVVESEKFRNELFEKEYKFVSELADPDKCAKEWDQLFLKIFQKNKSINSKSLKIKIIFLKNLVIFSEKLVYNKKMKEKNIIAWGKDEYEKLMD